ncbi:uncharacterized protein LOC115393018 [Salarias fasciatus]|uniref:uncharacterized protein LOC115393018 n=1 Tax=Salarias fasciatus TaxID=181472 RepID=UPI001176DCC6|nr:uncharacterized protein LOC115393018 [Salarias fasciatus]
MGNLLIYVGLLFVLQTSVSDEVVSLNCRDPGSVQFGESATINCSIEWKKDQNCRVDHYVFKNNNVDMCSGTLPGNGCESDNRTYISLTISEVLKEETVDIELHSIHGHDFKSVVVKPYGEPKTTPLPPNKTKTITSEPLHLGVAVQLYGKLKTSPQSGDSKNTEKKSGSMISPVIFGVAVLLIVSFALYITYRATTSRNQFIHLPKQIEGWIYEEL